MIKDRFLKLLAIVDIYWFLLKLVAKRRWSIFAFGTVYGAMLGTLGEPGWVKGLLLVSAVIAAIALLPLPVAWMVYRMNEQKETS